MYTVTTTHHNTHSPASAEQTDSVLPSAAAPVLQIDALRVPFAAARSSNAAAEMQSAAGAKTQSAAAAKTQSALDGLRDVSLSMAHGERVVLLGPSGEGKTTLLRAIAGLSPIAGGTVRVNGRDVTSLPPEDRSTVYLHQVPVLFPHLSVIDNVGFPLAVRGVGKTERHRAAQLLLDRLRLGGLENRLPHMLSGGQRHRVALARALSAQPHMLLLDEPLSALDPALRRDVREAIRDAHDDSAAGLMLVTHDLDDATSLGDRIAVMLGRTIEQISPAAELFARPASRAVMRFLGVHQELPGTMRDPLSVSTALGVLPLPEDVAARLHGATHITVGLRTDAIHCVAPGSTDTTVQVQQVHTRASGSLATVSAGELVLQASINALDAPQVGDHVALHIHPRGIIAFAG